MSRMIKIDCQGKESGHEEKDDSTICYICEHNYSNVGTCRICKNHNQFQLCNDYECQPCNECMFYNTKPIDFPCAECNDYCNFKLADDCHSCETDEVDNDSWICDDCVHISDPFHYPCTRCTDGDKYKAIDYEDYQDKSAPTPILPKKFCDRCGKYYEPEKKDIKISTNFVVTDGHRYCGSIDYYPVHICPDCIEEFTKWMQSGKHQQMLRCLVGLGTYDIKEGKTDVKG